MIKAVIFDLGGVYFTDGTKIAIDNISKKYKLPRESVKSLLKAGPTLAQEYRKGNISANQFWNKFKKTLNLKANNKDLADIWIKNFRIIRGTIGVIKKLKKRSIKVYFLSDGIKERIEYLQRKYGFLNIFDGGIFSYQVHKSKFESNDIFKIALKKTKQSPKNVIFIEDREHYVKKAEELEMKGIVFKNPKQLENELKKLNLF